jgi:hypothetical protein
MFFAIEGKKIEEDSFKGRYMRLREIQKSHRHSFFHTMYRSMYSPLYIQEEIPSKEKPMNEP